MELTIIIGFNEKQIPFRPIEPAFRLAFSFNHYGPISFQYVIDRVPQFAMARRYGVSRAQFPNLHSQESIPRHTPWVTDRDPPKSRVPFPQFPITQIGQ